MTEAQKAIEKADLPQEFFYSSNCLEYGFSRFAVEEGSKLSTWG